MRLGFDRLWLFLALALPALGVADRAAARRGPRLPPARGGADPVHRRHPHHGHVHVHGSRDDLAGPAVAGPGGGRTGPPRRGVGAAGRVPGASATFGFVLAAALAQRRGPPDCLPAGAGGLPAGGPDPGAAAAVVRDPAVRDPVVAGRGPSPTSAPAVAGALPGHAVGKRARQRGPGADPPGPCLAGGRRGAPGSAADAGGARGRDARDAGQPVRAGGLELRGQHRCQPGGHQPGRGVAADDPVRSAGPPVLRVGDHRGRAGRLAA